MPNSPSLAQLFGDVVKKSGVSPSDIALVEAHGTGTALCISGALNLKHALTLVSRRAQLVREAWGDDKGSMMAVEADESLV